MQTKPHMFTLSDDVLKLADKEEFKKKFCMIPETIDTVPYLKRKKQNDISMNNVNDDFVGIKRNREVIIIKLED